VGELGAHVRDFDGAHVSKGWMLDSGATRHFTPRKSDIEGLELFTSPKAVQIGKNNVQVHALGKGTVKINDMLTLHDVWYLPDSPFRIISTNQLTATGHPIVMLDDIACIVKDDIFLGAFTKNACGLLILNDNATNVMQTLPPTLSLALKQLHSRSSFVSISSHANCIVDDIRNDMLSDMSTNASSSKSKKTVEVNNFPSVAEDLHLTSHVLRCDGMNNVNPLFATENSSAASSFSSASSSSSGESHPIEAHPIAPELPTCQILGRYRPAKFQAGQFDQAGMARQLQFGDFASGRLGDSSQQFPLAETLAKVDPTLRSPTATLSDGAEILQDDSLRSVTFKAGQTSVNKSTVNGQRSTAVKLDCRFVPPPPPPRSQPPPPPPRVTLLES
jgi:hypothetical protein